MTDGWRRLLACVPTRRAAAALFVLALGVFAFQALGWPMAKGRDTWDYLVYYLQLLDGDPSFSELQVFRTPLTPIALGLPMQLGGSAALEMVFGVMYAITILAWSATALAFGRLAALASAVLLLVYPAFATLYHQASSDAVFATGLALWALLLTRVMAAPRGLGFAALGAGMGVLALVRPANQALLPLVLVPLLVPASWRRRIAWSGACFVGAVAVLGLWAVHNDVRYGEPTVARGGKAWVPFLRVFLADKTIAPENGPSSRRLADLIEQEVLARAPYASLDVSLDDYLQNGSNYETVRLIALSDRVYGPESDYDVLFDSALEAIREHPGTYIRGVADTFWEFLMQRPLREDVAPRLQTDPSLPPSTYERDGVVLPNPQAHVLVAGVPYGFVWCASDYLDSCTLDDPSGVWSEPEKQARYREIVARIREWDAELPNRAGVELVPELLNRITPRFPRPPLWLLVGLVALLVRRPARWRMIVVLWAAAFLVLVVHAASQGVAPEFALPLYPIFVVTALGALTGGRGRPT